MVEAAAPASCWKTIDRTRAAKWVSSGLTAGAGRRRPPARPRPGRARPAAAPRRQGAGGLLRAPAAVRRRRHRSGQLAADVDEVVAHLVHGVDRHPAQRPLEGRVAVDDARSQSAASSRCQDVGEHRGGVGELPGHGPGSWWA